jgi:YD repeat-containing protein
VARLEDRTLLSGPSGNVLAAVAPKIALGTPTTGTLAPGEAAFFQIDPITDGRLVARVHAEGAATRLSLWDAQGQVLMHSDGQSAGNPDDQIDLHVSAGTDYLEVENLGGAGAYTLTTTLTPATTPFQPISVGSLPIAIVAGDFNGDGCIDLAVVNKNSNDVSVLLGNGDGTFQEQKTYLVGDSPKAIVTGDFNGDGRTDLAVANEGSYDANGNLIPGTSSVSVLLGDGDGTFQNQVQYAVGSGPIALVAGDFNGDGRTDLAVANYNSNDVSVLLGNGDGTFQHQVRYAVGTGPTSVVVGDFNGDGRIDLAVVNFGDKDMSVLLGKSDGTFQNQVRYAVGTGPSALVAGDFTRDGRTDLAVANGGYRGSNYVSVLLGLNGTFAAPGPFAINPHATPLVTDLGGNGADDVMVINGAGDILWRKGRPQEPGTFDPPITINPGHPARDIVAVDTRQGPVLASVDASDKAVSLYAWRDGNFVRIGSLPTGSLPAQIVSGDLLGDGGNDLVVRNSGDGTLTVFFTNGSGSDATGNTLFPSSVTLPVGLGVSDVTLADVDQGGVPDIVITNKASGEVGVLRNLGDGPSARPCSTAPAAACTA